MTDTGPGEAWVGYASAAARFACRHPRSWGRAENVLGVIAVFVDGNVEWDELEGFRPNVTIGVEPRDSELDDDALFERHAGSPPTYLTDPILLDREGVEIAGVHAQRILVAHRQGPRTLTLEQWCLAARRRAIYLSAATTTNQFAVLQPVVEAIVATVELRDD